jgi:hypothetical protein
MLGGVAEPDEVLFERITSILSDKVTASPYADDGEFAAQIKGLPVGLRAMAATHCLDVSLTLDDICWHFGNFGDPALANETEIGLRVLGLSDLADCFVDAYRIMCSLTDESSDGEDLYDVLERHGLGDRAAAIDKAAWAIEKCRETKFNDSAIFGAWLKFAREFPERVFEQNSI